MIRFAVIGTNWITRQFVEAAHESGKYKLTAVYSRSLEQAQHFANDFSVEHLFTSLEAMAESDAIDAVYIASPNSLHFSQTQLFLSHKIHVICEKPLASNLAEVDAAIACARENQVVVMDYGDFSVTLQHSKVSDSVLASEIQGEAGSLVIEKLSECQKVCFVPRGSQMQDLTQPQHINTMLYEAELFATLVDEHLVNHPGLAVSHITAKLLTEIRRQTGVIFPADNVKL